MHGSSHTRKAMVADLEWHSAVHSAIANSLKIDVAGGIPLRTTIPRMVTIFILCPLPEAPRGHSSTARRDLARLERRRDCRGGTSRDPRRRRDSRRDRGGRQRGANSGPDRKPGASRRSPRRAGRPAAGRELAPASWFNPHEARTVDVASPRIKTALLDDERGRGRADVARGIRDPDGERVGASQKPGREIDPQLLGQVIE